MKAPRMSKKINNYNRDVERYNAEIETENAPCIYTGEDIKIVGWLMFGIGFVLAWLLNR